LQPVSEEPSPTARVQQGRHGKFIDLLERENEVKKLKAIDSLLIEKSFSDQLRDYNFKEGMQE